MFEDIAQWKDKLTIGAKLGTDCYREQQDQLPKKIIAVAFVGMGGSGIAGRIMKTLFDKKTTVMSTVIEGTELPGYVDQNTLAIVSSYSGNTWETIEVLNELIKRKIPTIIVAYGGRVIELAREKQLPWVQIPISLTPRSALGCFLGIFLALFDEYHVLNGHQLIQQLIGYLDEYLALVSSRAYFDDFLRQASGRDFFHIWGISGDSAACAYRAQTQFNENSKIQAVNSTIPELCHNLIIGFTKMSVQPFILLMYTNFISENLKKAVAATEELLHRTGVTLYKVPILGDTFECQLLHMVLWADFASCYLGQIHGVDLESVVLIDELKKEHKQKGITV